MKSAGAPQGCVLSPLLLTKFNNSHIIKFADDTTVVALIGNEDKSAYRSEVEKLTTELTTDKTKGMIIHARKTAQRGITAPSSWGYIGLMI